METRPKNSVLIGLSGGVDSSVAALLLQQNGYDCIGATMLLHKSTPDEPLCGSLSDVQDAEQVARRLGIPFHVLDHADAFAAEVIERFVTAYENGQTPNPCVDCNRYLKFERLYEDARLLGCSLLATGHYARIRHDPASDRSLLLRAADPTKDQSYFLWSLTQEQLARTRFPLGSLSKQEVRELALANGLVTAHKRDSQDICFVPNGKYAEFVEKYREKSYPPGDFVDTEGRVLGQHKGIIRYTVGQKKGLGLVLPEPLYVKEIDAVQNRVTLCRSEELFASRLTVRHLNLIAASRLDGDTRLSVKIRYRHEGAPATVRQTDEDTLEIVFDQPQRAITKGQSAVLYDGETVVGGGIIQ